MSDHTPRTVERECDLAIVGGSAAGLAAALQVVRQRRSVIVIDAGEPRNRPAAHMHGYLGHDGAAPSAFAAVTRDEVRSYGCEVLAARAVHVSRTGDGHFRVELTGGHAVIARRVLAATGLVDRLPDIDGLAAHWGRDVVHCPFCHGFEVRDRRLVQIITHPMGLHPAALFAHLSERFTLVLHDRVAHDDPGLEVLRAAGVDIVEGRVDHIVTGDDGQITAVELTDGERIDAEAVVISPAFDPRVHAFDSLGLSATPHPSGLGDVVETDASGETIITGLYAAGNVTDPSQQVLHAAADGSRVGAMISFSLAHEDLTAASRPSAGAADWDRRYSGEQMWSGNPNGSLVAEIGADSAGRALDVGAGEGGDAIWLAEHGWDVTAGDISRRALDRVAAEATRRGLSVTCHLTDANRLDAFDGATFDLVSAMYASIPRAPDGRGLENLLDAVAPGGTLLVVGHDLEPMRTPIDTHEHSRIFDPDAYLRVDDVAAAVAASPAWKVIVHEKRPRPAGALTTHRVDDIVLRARRHAG